MSVLQYFSLMLVLAGLLLELRRQLPGQVQLSYWWASRVSKSLVRGNQSAENMKILLFVLGVAAAVAAIIGPAIMGMANRAAGKMSQDDSPR